MLNFSTLSFKSLYIRINSRKVLEVKQNSKTIKFVDIQQFVCRQRNKQFGFSLIFKIYMNPHTLVRFCVIIHYGNFVKGFVICKIPDLCCNYSYISKHITKAICINQEYSSKLEMVVKGLVYYLFPHVWLSVSNHSTLFSISDNLTKHQSVLNCFKHFNLGFWVFNTTQYTQPKQIQP